ncbi:hypothetical protein HNO88_004498 [Novosphingobium chloroacetimidivorans]|uniref:Uncharacterized protein n=1 Tax=Novosphingobium chloroacetimidivorans TaxID=1428314 RepID=A0A7W7KF68_9SPHN|nr:hypothetical protein [Novosphingobium chloroacetimidivorans]MBB4861144.1 hypothetical protein [Novosphingobium chloroacetimidivorans]
MSEEKKRSATEFIPVAGPIHQALEFMSLDKRSSFHAGELLALIRVDQNQLLRFAPPYRHYAAPAA